MPMIPETVVAMLACARIGAPHSVVFGGFSADALADRDQRREAKVVITADGGYRRGAPSALKPTVDEALRAVPTVVEKVLVVRRTGQDVAWDEGRDVWWHDVVDRRVARARAPSPSTPSTRCHPLHLGHDRQAQGHPAHDRRLPARHVVHAPRGLRPQAGHRRLLVHRRRRLGHRPLATSSTARSRTARPRSCTRARPTTRTRTAGGRSSRSTRSRSSTPRRPRSGRS